MFLKTHPEILLWSFFDVGGHGHYVIPEFGLGKSLRCDFVLMQSFSGGWHVRFVELEPVKDKLYNKDRTPTRRLRLAQKQIADWQHYEHVDGVSLRTQLAEAAMSKNCFKREFNDLEPASLSGRRLRDPKTYVRFYYHIVIGRRTTLTEIANELRASSSFHTEVEIASYDRLLDVAENLDCHLADPDKTV